MNMTLAIDVTLCSFKYTPIKLRESEMKTITQRHRFEKMMRLEIGNVYYEYSLHTLALRGGTVSIGKFYILIHDMSKAARCHLCRLTL